MKILFALAILLVATGVSAQQPPLEHVLVSVPLHKKEAETALPVTVLSGEELQRQAAATIGETLGNMPGVANASFGPGVGRPVIRGQQGPRAVTLMNGTLSADASSLSPDHGVAVEPLLAESIEVLRGPSTLLYGGGAIGGVVNVVDGRIPRKPVEGFSGGVEYRHDEASDLDSGVFLLEGGSDRFAFHLDGSTRDSGNVDIPGKAIDEAAVERQEQLLGGHDAEEEAIPNTNGFIANSNTSADTVTVGGSYFLGDRGFTGFAVSHLETDYGIPPGSHGHEEEGDESESGSDSSPTEEHEEQLDEEFVRIDLEQTRYDGQLHLHDPFEGIEVMRGFLTYTDYEHKELENGETGTRFKRDTLGGRFEVVHDPIAGAHGVLGLQVRGDEFEAVGEEGYIPQTDSNEYGLFILEDFHWGDWTFETGLRGDYVTRDPDTTATDSADFSGISASASALWEFHSAWRSGISLSRSARAPATEELFSNIDATSTSELIVHAATGIIEVGDPDLDEETSLNIDLSLNWWSERSQAELAIFYNRFSDYIFLSNSGEEFDGTPIYLYEQDGARFYGIEFESDVHLLDFWSGEMSVRLFGDMIIGEFDNGENVPRLPPRRVGSQLNWSNDNLGAWLRVLNAADQDDPGEFETDTDGYTRWDLGADYRWRHGDGYELLTFIKWKNLTNEEIRFSTSFLRNYAPEAGRSIEVGLRYSF